MTYPARSIEGTRLETLMGRYLETLDTEPEFQDGIEMSEREIAERELESFIHWIEEQPTGV